MFRSPKSWSMRLVFVALVLLSGFGWYQASQWGKLQPDTVLTIDGFPEISGLRWLPERQTLVAVSDEGFIGEVDLQGNVVTANQLIGYDMESVITVPGQPDQALVMGECGARRLWFSMPDYKVLRVEPLPDDAVITDTCNNRIEGFAWHGHDGLVLANQGPATLLFFNRDLTELRKTVSLDVELINEVISLYDGSLLVVSRDDGLRVYSADGEPLGPWRRVSNVFIEGAAFVPGHGLILSADTDPSQLLFFPEITNDESLKAIFHYP